MSELQAETVKWIVEAGKSDLPYDFHAKQIINLCMDAAKAKGEELKSRSKNQVLWYVMGLVGNDPKEIDIDNYRNGYLNAIDDFVKAIESLKEQDK